MKELIIPLIRLERPTVTADIGPTPVEIQRWEDDGGAVLPAPQRRAHCHCAVDHRRRAAACIPSVQPGNLAAAGILIAVSFRGGMAAKEIPA